MASTKVMVRDRVSAKLGGNILALDGVQAHVLSLNLSGKALGDEAVAEMSKFVIAEVRRRHGEVQALRNTTVRLEITVRLDDNDIGDRGALSLVTTLLTVADLANFRLVNLFKNKIGDKGAMAVVELLREANVEACRMGGNPIGIKARDALAKAAKDRGSQMQLPLAPRSLFTLRDQVLSLRQVDSDLGDDDAVKIAEQLSGEVRRRATKLSLPTTASLVEIKVFMQQNNIGDRGAAALAEALYSVKDVAWVSDLRLYGNKIGDSGAASLATNVVKGMLKHVNELHLSDNNIGDAGARALFDAVAETRPKPLLWLQLKNNVLDHQALLKYAKSIKLKTCLVDKKCTRVKCVHNAGVHLMGFTTQRSRRDDSTSSSSSGISIRRVKRGLADDGAVALAVELVDVAKDKTQLRELSLDDNAIGDRGLVALAGALVHVKLERISLLSLSRNRLENADALTELLKTTAIAELRLDGNELTSCTKLVAAAAKRGQPLVLKLAKNHLSRAERRRARGLADNIVQLPDLEDQDGATLENEIKELQAKLESMKKEEPPRPEAAKKPSVPLAESMIEIGYSPKHAQWIVGAFERCERATKRRAADSWILFAPDEAFEYSISRPLTASLQRKLQDKLLLEGYVAIVVAGGPKRGSNVSVIACTDELEDKSYDDVELALNACLDEASPPPPATEKAADDDQQQQLTRQVSVDESDQATMKKKKKRRKPKKKAKVESAIKEEDAPEAAAKVSPSSMESSPRPSVETEQEERVAEVSQESSSQASSSPRTTDVGVPPLMAKGWGDETSSDEAGENDDDCDDARAAAAARAARASLDAAMVAQVLGDAGLWSTLESMDAGVAEYVGESLGKTTEVARSVLDAFVPAFHRLTDDVQQSCVDLVLRGGGDRDDYECVADAVAHARTLVDEGATLPDGTVARWAWMVTRLLRPDDQGAAAIAGVLLYWRARKVADQKFVLLVLRASACLDDDDDIIIKDEELLQAWVDRNRDLEATAKWLSAPHVDLRAALPTTTTTNKAQKAEELHAKADVKRREERRQRRLVLERYSQRPSDAGWKSSIKAKNVVYGSDTSKIRYLDGKVVTTTGQKEIVIRDGPAEGEGYNRIKKTGGGTLRCAAAGSKTIG